MSPTGSNSDLFRKEALKKQSVMQPLEERMRLIAPRWWISVLGIAVILLVAALWGWYGRTYTKVEGSGMVVESGGFQNMVSLSDGIIQTLNISEGVTITKGYVIAVLSLPLEQIELDHYQSRINSLQEDVTVLRELTDRQVEKAHRVHMAHPGRQRQDHERFGSASETTRRAEPKISVLSNPKAGDRVGNRHRASEYVEYGRQPRPAAPGNGKL